jgi:DNA-binding MarR family transcriptional regulator
MLSKAQYEALSDFRFQLARFQRFSERATRTAGITQTQYLLLLHIRGFRGREWARVGELATRLQASPHGTAALIKRCVALRLVSKRRNAADARCVEVHLAPRGDRLVRRIAAQHRDELRSLQSVFRIRHVSR